MHIQEIYDKYQIPPHLQLHMLRVAAITQTIKKKWEGEDLNFRRIITTALLHDLGNIIKFDMNMYPEVWQPEGVDYWIKVKENTHKYGKNEYEATFAIAKEIGIEKGTLELLHLFDFLHSHEKLETGNIAIYILDYADARVSPSGVVSIKERTDDFVQRNMKNKKKTFKEARKISDKWHQVVHSMEKIIFDKTALAPTDITDKKISNQIEQLRQFTII